MPIYVGNCPDLIFVSPRNRYLLVLAICALAIAIPDLGDIISLIGAMASSMLALIMPPVIDQLIMVKSTSERPKPFYFKSAKNLIIVIFGVMGMVVGTYVSIVQLVEDLEHPGGDTCVAANTTLTWYPPKIV